MTRHQTRKPVRLPRPPRKRRLLPEPPDEDMKDADVLDDDLAVGGPLAEPKK